MISESTKISFCIVQILTQRYVDVTYRYTKNKNINTCMQIIENENKKKSISMFIDNLKRDRVYINDTT